MDQSRTTGCDSGAGSGVGSGIGPDDDVNEAVTLKALERAMRNDELVLYYQPKVCLLSGEVLGAEALVRWTAGTDPVLSPDQFLPLVESSGLLHDLTLQLLDQLVEAIISVRGDSLAATAQMDSMGSSGQTPSKRRTALSLSINVAPNDLASRSISNHIDHLLRDRRILARELQIEITESAFMGNVDRVRDDLLRLKQMGVKIMMDDFGTGYSSLDRLSQLPFDALKLDQGIVKRMSTSRQNLDVVRSAISMARELGMTSVAEGIESEAAYNFLIAHGCEEGQGYHLGRPMSLVDFQGFLAREHDFGGSQIGRIHQACLNLLRFRKVLLDAAFCSRMGKGEALESVMNPDIPRRLSDTRLGRWYFGVGQQLSALADFRDIELPMQQVHERGLVFLDSLDNRQEQGTLDDQLSAIDSQVNRLIGLLHALERTLLAGGQD